MLLDNEIKALLQQTVIIREIKKMSSVMGDTSDDEILLVG